MINYFKSSPLGIVLGYLFGIVIAAIFGATILYNIAASKFNIDVTLVTEIMSMDIKVGLNLEVYNFVTTWLNFIQYAFMLLLTVFYAREYLKKDCLDIFDSFKKKESSRKRYLLMALLSIVGVLVMILASEVCTRLAKQTSVNQSSIETLILNGYAIPMFISVVFFAPVVEELLYRKAIFKFLDKTAWYIPVCVSSLLFALPHMLSPQANVLSWFILFFNYLLCGFILSMIYEKSNRNIYLSIFCHMLNNLVVFLMIIL